jgi:hypothetical protein
MKNISFSVILLDVTENFILRVSTERFFTEKKIAINLSDFSDAFLGS